MAKYSPGTVVQIIWRDASVWDGKTGFVLHYTGPGYLLVRIDNAPKGYPRDTFWPEDYLSPYQNGLDVMFKVAFDE